MVNIKSLTGKIDVIKIAENDPIYKLQLIYSSQINEHFECIKFIFDGKSLLTFDRFFQSLKNLNINDNDTIHMVLRLGGPQPEERAVFNYLKRLYQSLEVPQIETMITLFADKERIGIECPVCLTYQVNRVLSCWNHAICENCFNSLPEKRCPICQKFPVYIL